MAYAPATPPTTMPTATSSSCRTSSSGTPIRPCATRFPTELLGSIVTDEEAAVIVGQGNRHSDAHRAEQIAMGDSRTRLGADTGVGCRLGAAPCTLGWGAPVISISSRSGHASPRRVCLP